MDTTHLAKSIICIFGVVCNAVSGLVLIQPDMRCASSILLFGLTLADNFFLVALLLQISLIYDIFWSSGYMYYSLLMWASATGQTSSFYFTLVISLERLIVVCWPLKARIICTNERAIFISIVVFFWSAIICSPELIRLTGPNEILDRIWFHYLYWAKSLIQFVIPYTLLLIFNVIIFRTFRRAQKARNLMTNSQRSEMSTTIMLLLVVLVFGVCYITKLVDFVVGSLLYLFDIYNFLEWTYDDILPPILTYENISEAVNSSLNFVIYCAFGTRFREAFIKTCRSKRPVLRSEGSERGQQNSSHRRSLMANVMR